MRFQSRSPYWHCSTPPSSPSTNILIKQSLLAYTLPHVRLVTFRSSILPRSSPNRLSSRTGRWENSHISQQDLCRRPAEVIVTYTPSLIAPNYVSRLYHYLHVPLYPRLLSQCSVNVVLPLGTLLLGYTPTMRDSSTHHLSMTPSPSLARPFPVPHGICLPKMVMWNTPFS